MGPPRPASRRRGGRRWWRLTAALGILGVGVLLWQVLGAGTAPLVGPEDLPAGSAGDGPPRRVELPVAPRLAEKPPPPREGFFVQGEEFPALVEGFSAQRLYIPALRETRTVRGEEVRAALLALPAVYLRWQSPEVKAAFLRTEMRLRPDAGMEGTEDRPAGAPIPPALELLPLVGFRAWVRPPVVRIFAADQPNPDRPAPPR